MRSWCLTNFHPLIGLRGPRSRKNGPCGRRASNARKAFKSSGDEGSRRKCAPLPPYFTVDDLAAFRRKRVPPKYRDTLRPLSGSFATRTEYRSAYRSFVIAPDDSIVNWKKKMKSVDDEPEEAPAPEEAAPDLPAGEQYIRHPKTRSIRPADNLSCDGGACNASSEAKDKYVAFAHAKPAPLLRQPTHLKVEGDFEGASETKRVYKRPEGVSRAPLQRRHTQLQLEGDMQLASEKAANFVRFENAQRAPLQRRHTTLELAGDCANCADCASEYHRAFGYPQRGERARLMRSLENLRADGPMHFRPEYASNYIDFQAAYPQIKYRERRRSLVEAHRERYQQCEVKTTLAEGATVYSPEYRHAYVRFPARRPITQRPHTNLVPPCGIGETESQLKSQMRQVWLPKSAGAPAASKTDCGLRSQSGEERNDGWREKPFRVLPEIAPDGKNVNFADDITGRPSESRFRKGQRLPAAKSSRESGHAQSPNLETDSKRPTYRLEVTNPDHKQRAFEKQQSSAPFIVLDENNNTNQRTKSKQNQKRWTPSWMKV